MVKKKFRVLLIIDAMVNLLLGILLLFFPVSIIRLLGLPPTHTNFYATILGGVIFGIGLALCIEWWGAPFGGRGLGLGGAIVINICGAGVLLVWLLSGALDIQLRAKIVLWGVAIVVLGIGFVEVAVRSWKYDN